MSKELYNTLEEALHSQNVFTLLSSCNDIALVVYDSDNLTYAELLSDFFYYNDLEPGNIKEIIIHGKNKIAIRRKTLDISSYFIAPQITYTGLSGSDMYNYSQLKKTGLIRRFHNNIGIALTFRDRRCCGSACIISCN